MSVSLKAISKYTGKEYKVMRFTGPILVCDILGFKEIVNRNELLHSLEILLNIVDALHGMSLKDVGIEYFRGNESIYKKIEGTFPRTLKLEGMVVSDTIIIYPSTFPKDKPIAEEIIMIMLSIISMLFFRFMTKEMNLLVRGTLTYGEVGIVESPQILTGKGLIEAYELEKIQNWGGIIPSPVFNSMLKNSPARSILFKEYDVPIKPNKLSYYTSQLEKYNVPSLALDWPRHAEDIDWDILYKNAESIVEDDLRMDAIEKIDKTKEYYEFVIENT